MKYVAVMFMKYILRYFKVMEKKYHPILYKIKFKILLILYKQILINVLRIIKFFFKSITLIKYHYNSLILNKRFKIT